MNHEKQGTSLLEYAVKELKEENFRLQDKIDKLAKTEIQQREDLLSLQSAALEAAANGIVITDFEGKINWINPACSKLTGYSYDDLIGQRPSILRSGQHDDSFYKNMWETISAGKIWKGEINNKRKTGEFYTEDMVITPVINNNNVITNFIAIKQDITERKQQEKIIRESELIFKAITNSTNDAIFCVDKNFGVVLWNSAAEKLFGYNNAEVINHSLLKLIIAEKSVQLTKEMFNRALGIGKDFKGTLKLDTKKKNGDIVESELSISLTEIASDWFITCLCRDLSGQKSLKSASEKEKEKIIESLKNELAIVKSEYNILNSIINVLPHHIYVKDQQSRFIKANNSMIEFMGVKTEEELLGKSDLDFFTPAIAQGFLDEEQVIMTTGKAQIGKEHVEIKQDGGVSWAQTSKFPLFNSENKSIGTFGITVDLSDLKEKEFELEDSHYKFRKLIENSTLGIMRLDEDGEILMVNPAMIKMLDYNCEKDILSKRLEKIFYSKNSRKKFMYTLKREHKISGYEDILIRKDNTLIEVRQSAWAVKDKNDAIIYYEVIVEDITEQNQVLKILHESEFKYRMLIDKLSEAVYLLIGRKFEIVNSKFLEILEITEEELYRKGFNILEYISDQSKEMVLERERKIKQGETVPKVYEMTIVTKSGIEKEIEISVSYLNFNGKTGTQGIIRDLTEMRKQETQIRHLQKMEAIGTLAAGIAHEINTPSQFVNDNLSFLKDAFSEIHPMLTTANKSISEEKEVMKLFELIKSVDLEYLTQEIPAAIDQSLEGVGRIANIVGAMRDFAHTGPKDKVSADIHNIISSSITLSKNAWKYVTQITTDFDESIPHIICQPNDINQVIVNMIVNSSHALEDKFGGSDIIQGNINIKTINCNETIEIIIEDNGAGMSEKVMKRIFDPFYTTKDVGKGTGQGLAIAYDIIRTKHNGDIEVKSEEGVGTIFKLTLPVEPTNAKETK